MCVKELYVNKLYWAGDHVAQGSFYHFPTEATN